jgi:hypothetical protein
MTKKIELPDELATLHARCLAMGDPQTLVDGLLRFYATYAQERWARSPETDTELAARRERDKERAWADAEFDAKPCPQDCIEHRIEILGYVPEAAIAAAKEFPGVVGFVQHAQSPGRLRVFLSKRTADGLWLRPDSLQKMRADLDDAIRCARVPGEYVTSKPKGVNA